MFTGEPGGPEDPGTGPEDPPVVVDPPAATPGTLRWGVKSQFRDYVLGPIAHGSISTAGGAGTSGSEFTFPQSASAIDSASGLGTASFRGSVRFTGHAGALSVLVGDPVVRLTSATSGSAVGRHGDGTRRLRDPRPRLRDPHGRRDRRDQLHRDPGDAHGGRSERVRRLLQRR